MWSHLRKLLKRKCADFFFGKSLGRSHLGSAGYPVSVVPTQLCREAVHRQPGEGSERKARGCVSVKQDLQKSVGLDLVPGLYFASPSPREYASSRAATDGNT